MHIPIAEPCIEPFENPNAVNNLVLVSLVLNLRVIELEHLRGNASCSVEELWVEPPPQRSRCGGIRYIPSPSLH